MVPDDGRKIINIGVQFKELKFFNLYHMDFFFYPLLEPADLGKMSSVIPQSNSDWQYYIRVYITSY